MKGTAAAEMMLGLDFVTEPRGTTKLTLFGMTKSYRQRQEGFSSQAGLSSADGCSQAKRGKEQHPWLPWEGTPRSAQVTPLAPPLTAYTAQPPALLTSTSRSFERKLLLKQWHWEGHPPSEEPSRTTGNSQATAAEPAPACRAKSLLQAHAAKLRQPQKHPQGAQKETGALP